MFTELGRWCITELGRLLLLLILLLYVYVCMSTEIGRKWTNGGAAAAAVLAPLSGHTCWIVLPVCSRVRALHRPLWVCLTDKTLFTSIAHVLAAYLYRQEVARIIAKIQHTTIDHILVSPELEQVITASGTCTCVGAHMLSDHNPTWITLDIPRKEQI